ncbi:MAG: family 43 glycosylhydrolase, partial [Clostridiaceae bacterium]|nr:family 43 glycosylhydrolase [Clostridiaceae bacterium]
MRYYCNPLNLEYRYQFSRTVNPNGEKGKFTVFREAADPSLVLFKNFYYLFPSKTAGFFTSQDLINWEFHEFKQDMPIHDYAPDVCVVGEYLYFCASKRNENCSFFRTKNPLTEPFEEIKGTFPFWDPKLFLDDDGKLYLYWGCSNNEPIYGVELDSETMRSLTEPIVLINSCEQERGYERNGEDHIPPKTEEEIQEQVEIMLMQSMKMAKIHNTELSAGDMRKKLYAYMSNRPNIEGAWMTKYNDKYYLEYAIPGTQYNIYGDGVYIGESPLGPFEPTKNNPYSYKPGGFITGAGHGSTLKDKEGRYWHTSTMRISLNHKFERRLGLWKAGFDEDGELFCDQRYGDWPVDIDKPPFSKPDWMLLSYGKKVRVSSGTGAENVTDENIRTWWRASSNQHGEWVEVDLGKNYDVRAVQINFADEQIKADLLSGEEPYKFSSLEERYIDKLKQNTRWLLEGSLDGEEYFVIEDKRETHTDYAHDFMVWEEGIRVRFLKLTIEELPYNAVPCVSGIRVFGLGEGNPPEKVENVTVNLDGDLDMVVSWKKPCEDSSVGYNILWGYASDKLYHSYMVF